MANALNECIEDTNSSQYTCKWSLRFTCSVRYGTSAFSRAVVNPSSRSSRPCEFHYGTVQNTATSPRGSVPTMRMADRYARYLYATRFFHNGGGLAPKIIPLLTRSLLQWPHQGAHMKPKPGFAITPVVMLLDVSHVDILLLICCGRHTVIKTALS
jgi:hypothetical protein